MRGHAAGQAHVAKPVPAPRTAHARREQPRAQRIVLLATVTVLAAINIAGAPYYLAPLAERVRSPLHPWLRPSGTIGQSAGLLAFAIFAFLWLYPLRKRFRWLAFTGTVSRWLDMHVTAALALPLLLTIHSAWRFTGVIGLGVDAMLVVWASGIVGRYLYTRIPRAKNGVELTLEEVTGQRRSLLGEISAATGIDPATLERSLALSDGGQQDAGLFRIFARLLTNDLVRWRKVRELRRRWRELGARSNRLSRQALDRTIALANREILLHQQAAMLGATQRVFRFWHVAHRPVAVTALIAVSVHVAIVVALGATWLW